MPKITSQGSPAKTSRLKTSSNSPRKTKQTEPRQEEDRSQWRPSRIPQTAKINKSAALTYYHLSRTNGLDGLSFETVTKLSGHGDTVVKMFLYSESEVEMRAWEKYGGPKGFERMLDDKEAKFYSKNGGVQSGKTFHRPRDYPSKVSATLEPRVRVMGPPEQSHVPDPETSTPGLIAMRDLLVGRGQQWMWNAINKVISNKWEAKYGRKLRRRDRESLVDCALKILDMKYPPRPTTTSSSPESSSFQALIATLTRAHSPTYEPGYDDPEVIKFHFDGFTGEHLVHWTQKYSDEVYACLIKIIQEHGLDGWMRARWLVYDQVSRTFKQSQSTGM
ncbi:hypothetical protein HYPSUDRAFT_37159 [Hypholoma sublateritium FD-334 SS-4]|uniref:Uncharacterized protein n=1 Tax=Hypholoma sublateritium (strain FD-334 SS-4) TaxID=945553 RepID=A0A0D2MP92_HYPSF|nr:hypothetical protein HYPSUDRAFT_37159 [Hypholoma sublateritium FD-334 SS-4]